MAVINNKVKAVALFVGIVWALYGTIRVNQKWDPNNGGKGGIDQPGYQSTETWNRGYEKQQTSFSMATDTGDYGLN